MNKPSLVRAIVAQLKSELAVYYKAARAAHAEATHEQSKAESKYDTRGLEASYLARGQSRQAAEIETAIQELQALPLRDFAAGEGIDLGALVTLDGTRESSCYFIAPRAGGTEVTHARTEVLVITPQSPMGRQLAGRKQGERIRLQIAGAQTDYTIASVA